MWQNMYVCVCARVCACFFHTHTCPFLSYSHLMPVLSTCTSHMHEQTLSCFPCKRVWCLSRSAVSSWQLSCLMHKRVHNDSSGITEPFCTPAAAITLTLSGAQYQKAWVDCPRNVPMFSLVWMKWKEWIYQKCRLQIILSYKTSYQALLQITKHFSCYHQLAPGTRVLLSMLKFCKAQHNSTHHNNFRTMEKVRLCLRYWFYLSLLTLPHLLPLSWSWYPPLVVKMTTFQDIPASGKKQCNSARLHPLMNQKVLFSVAMHREV